MQRAQCLDPIETMADPTKSQSKNPRKKLPKEMAVIDVDNCTGCGACIEVCPVDCIVEVNQYPDAPGLQGWCEIDWDRCIGCRLCIRLPRKKSDAYAMLICPWEAIEMVPIAELPASVDLATGPAAAEENRPRLLEAAERQARLAKL